MQVKKAKNLGYAAGLPPKQGLYDPQFEHDACGIGMVVQVSGAKSHAIICQAMTILVNLAHRGGAGSESQSGDGAGILFQLPDKLFRQVCPGLGITLPPAGEYGTGMVFLPRDAARRQVCEQKIERIVHEEGQSVLGWRTLPVNDALLGEAARACRPYIRQLFIGRSADLHGHGDLDFEKKLYVIRKRCEQLTSRIPESSGDYFYFASLSCRTIVYKGMLTAGQVGSFYLDLASLETESALALVHSRYSTNTFPSWERAHPYRYLIHNGEINTLRGNINWMNARQGTLAAELDGIDPAHVFPLLNPNGSDSAIFDNCLEFLVLNGWSLPRAAMLMVPEPWQHHEGMSDDLKAFYEYHSTVMEPWDGPAAMAFTDGVLAGAILDRNGLRPSRYLETRDGLVVLASEAGVLDIPPENILRKDRLRPGRMLLIDTAAGRVIDDAELKSRAARAFPYRRWLDENVVDLASLTASPITSGNRDPQALEQLEKAFGYTYEDLQTILLPMARDAAEPLGSMGTDTPLAVLSDKPQLLYNYFKQMFAQVTNPPIDTLREEIVLSTETTIGATGSLLRHKPAANPQIRLQIPILTNQELQALRQSGKPGLMAATLPILCQPGTGSQGLEKALDALFAAAREAIAQGAGILILSDRGVDENHAPIPALLAVSGLHQHLTQAGLRTRASLVLESGEPREVHHFALLLAYGVSAVNPWLAFEIIGAFGRQGLLEPRTNGDAAGHYIKAIVKGIVKIMSKMGISAIQSYRGAQLFEAVGIAAPVIDRYFTATISRIGGADLAAIAEEARRRHTEAYDPWQAEPGLSSSGQYRWRSQGEYHLYNPLSIQMLQQSVRQDDFQLFQAYTRLMNEEAGQLCTLRSALELRPSGAPVPLAEVEAVDSIVHRFKTGAMSYGSISQEAHETLALAMNRLGGRSNTGEGGEDPRRFIPLENGDSLCSAIKQVASGRFGVTSEYLASASEIQIKMAQGAKPGEGGQLPGRKVYPWIARTRHSTPGVGLISPPPHHDIYSIEDLAELIHDLKNANDQARISVKLVSEAGVGTIAAGVAKGLADVILISGYDGGTGASPLSSIRHAGLPWELGLAETHQTLVLNRLRQRVRLETDGKLLTGRDVVFAALLGADEFGFATGPLVAMGCLMMRVCDRDTCPVGIATQNPELRKRFAGKPEHVERFLRFIAADMREIMARLGFRTVDEMVGRTDCLSAKPLESHWKASGLDLSPLLLPPAGHAGGAGSDACSQNHKLDESLDERFLLPICRDALLQGLPLRATLPIRNVNRAVGTRLGSEITRRYGSAGLPEDTLTLRFRGSAGLSFGAFIPRGLTLLLEGEANDYLGKGLSGGKIVVRPDPAVTFKPEENILIGNVALYGATSGEAYIQGGAGERFCVRNSGASAVAEAAGDHGCEYMTGGRVVILGPVGRNFAAGMSGGIAYVLDHDGTLAARCNTDMADLAGLTDPDDVACVRNLVEKHVRWTGSTYARGILERWEVYQPLFKKVIPREYQRMQAAIRLAQRQGLHGDEALLAAFSSSVAAADSLQAGNGD